MVINTNVTALHIACNEGQYDVVQWLLNHGADVNMLAKASCNSIDTG